MDGQQLRRCHHCFPIRLGIEPARWPCIPPKTTLGQSRLSSHTWRYISFGICVLLRDVCDHPQSPYQIRVPDRYAAIFWVRRTLQHPHLLAVRTRPTFDWNRDI